jgi:DASH complex subunit DAD3
MSAQIFDVNPYENHPELTQTEAEVLWEYAKLNQRLKIVSVVLTSSFFSLSKPMPFRKMIAETKRLSQVPEEHLLKDMRQVETKMGFVLTLVSANPVCFPPICA